MSESDTAHIDDDDDSTEHSNWSAREYSGKSPFQPYKGLMIRTLAKCSLTVHPAAIGYPVARGEKGTATVSHVAKVQTKYSL